MYLIIGISLFPVRLSFLTFCALLFFRPFYTIVRVEVASLFCRVDRSNLRHCDVDGEMLLNDQSNNNFRILKGGDDRSNTHWTLIEVEMIIDFIRLTIIVMLRISHITVCLIFLPSRLRINEIHSVRSLEDGTWFAENYFFFLPVLFFSTVA